MASMTRDLGLGRFYASGYYWLTMHSHATPYRVQWHFIETKDGITFDPGPWPEAADAALAEGVIVLAMVLAFQDAHFRLGFGDEVGTLVTEYVQAVQARRKAASADS